MHAERILLTVECRNWAPVAIVRYRAVFDVIVENAGDGIDTVYTNSNYALGANVEQLYLQESAGAATGVGNGEQNLIVGNSFANALD